MGHTMTEWANIAIDALSVIFAEDKALIENFINERMQDALEAFYLEKVERKGE